MFHWQHTFYETSSAQTYYDKINCTDSLRSPKKREIISRNLFKPSRNVWFFVFRFSLNSGLPCPEFHENPSKGLVADARIGLTEGRTWSPYNQTSYAPLHVSNLIGPLSEGFFSTAPLFLVAASISDGWFAGRNVLHVIEVAITKFVQLKLF
jgi:hypothetical protein